MTFKAVTLENIFKILKEYEFKQEELNDSKTLSFKDDSVEILFSFENTSPTDGLYDVNIKTDVIIKKDNGFEITPIKYHRVSRVYHFDKTIKDLVRLVKKTNKNLYKTMGSLRKRSLICGIMKPDLL